MASQGPNSPGTMADDATVGTVAWSNPDNAKVSDNVYATVLLGNSVVDSSIKIVKADGTFGTTNKSAGAGWSTTESYASFGSSSDLWGETWTAENINDVDFGVGFSAYNGISYISHYLKATNFGFSIPTGATINGILVEIERKASGLPGEKTASVDHIRITVYYTETSGTRLVATGRAVASGRAVATGRLTAGTRRLI